MHGCTVYSWQSQLLQAEPKKKKWEKCSGETQTPESLQSKRALKQLGKNKFWLNYFM